MDDTIKRQNIAKEIMEELINEVNHLETIYDKAGEDKTDVKVICPYYALRLMLKNKIKEMGHRRRLDGYWLHPGFTSQQKEEICSRIGMWYEKWKPILIDWKNKTHRLGYAREELKTMLCDQDDRVEKNLAVFKKL